MAVDIKDVEQVAQELQQKFDDFKAKNDKRVDAIEQEKGKLAGQVETLNGKLSELENLKTSARSERGAALSAAGVYGTGRIYAESRRQQWRLPFFTLIFSSPRRCALTAPVSGGRLSRLASVICVMPVGW